MKKIAILGGGISGLSLAYFLQKKWKDEIELHIFEKATRLGGWIKTSLHKGHFFEHGPRGFRPGGPGRATLQLALELGLENELIPCDEGAKRRYILGPKGLFPLPYNASSLLGFPFKGPLLLSLFKDLNAKKGRFKDESVRDLFSRHLHPKLIENLVDPFFSGIYGGSIDLSSGPLCFGGLWEIDSSIGSWIKGAFSKKREKKLHPLQKHPLLNFRGGMQQLVNALENALQAWVHLDEGIVSLKNEKDKLQVGTQKGCYAFDSVFSTLPLSHLTPLLPLEDPIPNQDTHSIRQLHLLVDKESFPKQYKGFGYLVPSYHKLPLLGCVFDSYAFPLQSQEKSYVKLTLMFGGSRYQMVKGWDEEKLIAEGLLSITKHLGKKLQVKYSQVIETHGCLPQFSLGFKKQREDFQKQLIKQMPRLSVMGVSYSGVAVNNCIDYALKRVEAIEDLATASLVH